MKYTYDEFNVVTEDSFKVAIRAKDDDGCLYEQSTYVYVWKDFWAPTSFSPNGDGINDVFRFYGGEYVENFHFMIFNRVGQIIFEGNHIDDEWDGNYSNGKPCPQEIYGWVVTYSSNYKGIEKEGEQKGFITIIK